MLSPEFKEAVRSRNVLRTRIMIKDAFVTDPRCFSMRKIMDLSSWSLMMAAT